MIRLVRGYLRQILLDSLQPNTVQYGKTLLRVESIQGSNYKHKLIFKDGSESEEIDLIVGADGAWSRVKECLENAPKPVYAGLQVGTHLPFVLLTVCVHIVDVLLFYTFPGLDLQKMIDLTITKPSPELLAEYGAGMVFILSPGQVSHA